MTSSVIVVAEATLPVDGSLDTAFGFVRAAAHAGVDALRFAAPRGPGEPSGESEWSPVFTDASWWVEVSRDTLRSGMDFMATVAAESEVNLLRSVGIMGWSVSATSGLDVVEAAARTHLPIFLRADWSAGRGGAEAASLVGRYDLELTVLHEPARSPTPPEALGLDLITDLRVSGFPRVGFCDRSGSGWASLASVALGADVVEVPLALSPYLPALQRPGALDAEGLKSMVAGARYLAWARAHPLQRGNI
jgi:N,N'-diacetyllegionaminate synthase